MAKTQQDVIIYNEKSFSTAQNQFEKDLKELQLEGWRLVNVTPTKKRGFGHIVQLTAIYEKEVEDGSETSAATKAQEKAREAAVAAENKTKAKAERRVKAEEAQRIAKEKEQAYRASLSPEQLQQYLKRKRRNNLIATAIVLGALILCIAVGANNSTMQQIDNLALTPVPTATPVPPTPTPNLNTDSGIVTYTKSILGSISLNGNISNVTYDGSLHITEYINSNGVWDKNAAKTDIEEDSFTIMSAVWNSNMKTKIGTVYVVIQSDLKDAYGNSSQGDMGQANLIADRAARFNWNGLTAQDAWNNQDYSSQWMLPDIANS